MVCRGGQAQHPWEDAIQQALDEMQGDIGPHWGTVQGRDQGEKNSKEEPQGR